MTPDEWDGFWKWYFSGRLRSAAFICSILVLVVGLAVVVFHAFLSGRDGYHYLSDYKSGRHKSDWDLGIMKDYIKAAVIILVLPVLNTLSLGLRHGIAWWSELPSRRERACSQRRVDAAKETARLERELEKLDRRVKALL